MYLCTINRVNFYRMDMATLHIGDYIMYACAAGGVMVALVGLWLLGGREWIGEKVANLLPHDTLSKGDKAHIYLNGRYNRTATLTRVVADAVYIYDNKVKLPLDYRARFYGIGVDSNDGSRLIYLSNRGYYRLIRVAELIRKVFNLVEDESNLNPDYADDEQLLTEVAEEGAEEDEK